MRADLELERTFADICVLYELALAAGGSLDLRRSCEGFLSALMARRGFALASVWLLSERVPDHLRTHSDREPGLELVWGAPRVQLRESRVDLEHPLWRSVRARGSWSCAAGEREFERLICESGITGGVFALFPIGEFGVLKLHSRQRSEPLDYVELAQCETVVGKFAVGLEGCLAHEKLVLEIRERERAEREKHAMAEQLHQSRKMEAIGRLAGGIAHDFNNVLMAVMGNASLLKEKAAPGTDLHEGLSGIVQAAERAAKLTRQLLAFARKGPRADDFVDLDGLVSEVSELLRRTLDPSIVLRLELCASGKTVRGDPAQLHTALLNLVVNARDAMPHGGILSLSTRCAGPPTDAPPSNSAQVMEWIELSVRDTGHGMSEAVLERVFEPFYTTKPLGEGTGLGLAAVFGIAQDHGGRVFAESTVGMGSCFKLLLPAARGVPEPGPKSSARTAAGAGCVLVADDDAAVRYVTVRMLKSLGYEVIEASNGREALELARLRREELRVAVLDLRMPELDGVDTLRGLRRLLPELPVTIVSGYGDPDAANALEELGVHQVLSKPFSQEDLAQHLQRALASGR